MYPIHAKGGDQPLEFKTLEQVRHECRRTSAKGPKERAIIRLTAVMYLVQHALCLHTGFETCMLAGVEQVIADGVWRASLLMTTQFLLQVMTPCEDDGTLLSSDRFIAEMYNALIDMSRESTPRGQLCHAAAARVLAIRAQGAA